MTWLSTEPSAYLTSGFLRRDFDCFRNGDAERAGAVGMLLQDRAAGFGLVGRRGDAARAIGFHQGAAIRFLVVGDADLEHGHVNVEQRAGEGERRAPLAGARLGRQLFYPRLFVVPGLRHGGVGLVRAGGRDAFIFEVDFCRRAELLFQPARADQRRRAPHAEDVAHGLGNVDLPLGRDLLEDQLHRKQRLEIGGADRLLGAGMQDRLAAASADPRRYCTSFSEFGVSSSVYLT